MKKFDSAQFLDQLQSDVRAIILRVHYLQQQDPEGLQQSPASGQWSVAQVLEHLNSYSRYYLPAIQQALNNHQTRPKALFKAGWLGNYFTSMMRPGPEGQVKNKMKAMRGHIPEADVDAYRIIQEFLQQQQQLLELLETARKADLGRIRIAISIAPFIRLKLGDTFHFFIVHEQRHFVQIERVLKALGTKTAMLQ
ncbi:MAG: DinB family protein [Candidatus Pseudobacter hemicellulosilyticus]|uniref:DinB family protein n=1 Tax=Candidatus Pseudobacter hemicellulosilyticus TaxID=3121375 RepID=A0AAJ5WTC7_9BACT|nr:MAG: DinB family protein [Pseudobacter sp.]